MARWTALPCATDADGHRYSFLDPFSSGGLSRRIARHQFQLGACFSQGAYLDWRRLAMVVTAAPLTLRPRDAQLLIAARAERQSGRIAPVAQEPPGVEHDPT